MRTNHQPFQFEDSMKRIREHLSTYRDYYESDDIPERHHLTSEKGTYVQCASMFIDLRGSSQLNKTYTDNPKALARIYQAYISEMVAIVNSFKSCQEINIVGDGISAMFAGNRGEEEPVIEALRAASMCNGLMKILNGELEKKFGGNFQKLEVGIGIALGRALVVKVGLINSGIYDLVYIGNVVNQASKMCGLAYKHFNEPICVTSDVYEAIGDVYANKEDKKTFQNFLKPVSHPKYRIVYTGNFNRRTFRIWSKQNPE
ncbi:adenylate/guanylate cyclase domain-containing protein [Exiguobacterium sp. K1]|uniref:adenylate/guanylate cyclase domain-containing protein n=1 Tax=Exiguobacterium sp. K1 TaxID=2980105 RepID=UPI00299E839A|nr:adenylate/guanylate cyclase domain-containing protein [Exiguobacterium sp. K1]MDX1260837.1 adenylate/guanylate cyclase domain-containing protein [Exiguobacterium sp. K1]